MTKTEARKTAKQHLADRFFMASFDNDQLHAKGERTDEEHDQIAEEILKQADRIAHFLGVEKYDWGY